MYDLGGEMGLQASVGRQTVLVAKMPFTFEDLTSGEAGRAIVMPGNARVIGGELVVYEAFNSATSDEMTVGDEGDPDRYLGTTSIATVGRTALVPTEHKYTGKSTIDVVWTGTGAAPTQGSGEVLVQYVIDNRANEVQPVGVI